MKRFLLFFSSVLFWLCGFSQSDNCSSATPISVTANCSSPTSGTTAGATQTIPGCSGTADDDVWYSFVATGTSHQINVTGSASFDAVVELFSSSCGTLISLSCMDNTFSGQTETINATGLTVGTTYHIRVYNYGAGSGSSTFTICVTNPPPAPANNSCFAPTSLTVNTSCTYTSGTTVGATQSYAGCSGTADDDVWYTFTANSSVMTITVDPSSSMDAVVELYSGSCGAFTSISCMDVGFTDGTETINANGLSIGATYYVKVYDYYSGGGYPFQICVSGTPPSGAPSNDACVNAIALPSITAVCNYFTFSNVGATESPSPTPSSCAGGSGAMDGGFSTSTIADVWFKIVVPSSGVLAITADPNVSAGWISDGTMALYSGTCGALTQIACADDYAYPGSSYDLLPFIKATGLTPGATVYLRYWGYGGLQGNFGFCVTSVSNDDCSSALYICDLNGYGASTKGYTRGTFPVVGNMYGNNQSQTTGAQQAIGTNTGGLFGTNLNGQNGSAAGASAYDVTIDNNSWIRFTAASTTVVLNVTVSDCWNGGGVQMQIFKTSDCSNYTVVSDFHESTSGFTLTAPGLTVGQDYYLEIDGFGGDLCNYVISANAGVQLPAITATSNPVCYGNSTTLTAPNITVGSYEWLPGGQTTQSITVNPYTTATYSCVVTGVCGQKQTLTKQIVVNPLPVITINSGNPVSVCSSHSVTLSASGASTYTWSPGTGLSSTTGASVTASPTVTTTYTITGKDANTCTNTAVVTVTVNPTPAVSVNSAIICKNASTTLTASGASTYNWNPSTGLSGSSGTSVTANPTVTTTYTVTGTAANSCTASATSTVTVNALPNITVSPTATTVCKGTAVLITSSGAASTSSYTWSDGSVNTNTISVSPTVTTTYTVTGTAANTCTATATATVNVNALPTVSANNLTLCANQSGNITATGASSYSWSTGATGPVISIVNPSSSASYTVTGTDGNNCSNTAVANLTANSIPQLSSSYTIAPSACGASTGSITGVSVTGNGTLSYSWTNSSNAVVGTSADISGIPAGTYNLTVTDGNTCNNIFSFSVTNPGSPIAPSASVTASPICEGGTVSLSAGTISNATYQWTGPNGFSAATQNASIPNATPAASGTYSVTATVTGCTGPAGTVSVIVNPLPVVSASTQNSSYCSGNTISLFGSGGNTYSWTGPNSFSSSQQNPTISNATTTMGGTYSLTATDANTCVNTATVSLTVNPTPTITAVSVSPNAVVCEGQNITLNSTVSGSPVFLWAGPNGFFSASQNPSINNVTPADAGTYVLVATAGTCVSTPSSLSVTVNSLPAVSASSQSSVYCSGNTIVLTGAGTAGTYSWTGPNTFTSSAQSPSISSSTTGMSGTYTLSVTDGNNCTNSDTANLTVNPTPTVTAVSVSPNATVCEGQTITLNSTVSGNPVYQWTGPNGFTSAQQNPTISNALSISSGTYTLFATEANCASAQSTLTVTVNALPVVDASSQNNIYCTGSTIVLTGTGTSGTFSWTGPAGFTSSQQNVAISNSTTNMSGTYTLSVTDANNCTSSDTINLAVSNTPTITVVSVLPAAVICEGQTITLTSLATGTPAYEWSGPNGFSSSSQNDSIPNATVAASGTYSVIAIAGNCTSATGTVNVTVNALPVAIASATQQTICAGGTLQLNATGAQSYSWSGPNGFTDATSNPSLTNVQPAASGVYTVTAVDANACSDTAQIAILINTLPAANANAASSLYCEGSTINLSGTGGGTYNWSGPNGFSSAQQNPVISNSSAAATGVYTLTVTDNNNCQNSDTANVLVNPTPVISNVAGDSSCNGSSLTLSAATSSGVINWYSDAGLTQLLGSGTTFSPAGLVIDSAYTFYIQASNSGCYSTTSSVTGVVHLVNASFTSSVLQGVPPTSVTFTNTSTGFNATSSAAWNFSDGPDDFNYNSAHTFNLPGSYNVSLIMINTQNGCVDTANATIVVLDEITISVPNVFTPNGDDVNDFFEVTVHGAITVEGWIMNRWGQIMFNWSGPSASWDGKGQNGQNATDATYFYIIKATSYGGKKKEFEGYLLLVR